MLNNSNDAELSVHYDSQKMKTFWIRFWLFWKKINKNRKNTPNRALQIVSLIILFIYQNIFHMHQTMQNCLPINLQRVNRWKIEVVNVFFIDLGPPAQFVRHCRMGVNIQLAQISKSWKAHQKKCTRRYFWFNYRVRYEKFFMFVKKKS